MPYDSYQELLAEEFPDLTEFCAGYCLMEACVTLAGLEG